MMRFIEGAKTMFKAIFGVPPVSLAGQNAVTRQREAAPMYLPASAVPDGGIDGVAVDGSTWMPWRVSSTDRAQWYVRTSIHGVEPSPAIVAELQSDDFDDDDDDTEAGEKTTAELLEAFRRNVQLVKARHSRGEMRDEFDADDGEIGDADDDEFGDFSDEL